MNAYRPRFIFVLLSLVTGHIIGLMAKSYAHPDPLIYHPCIHAPTLSSVHSWPGQTHLKPVSRGVKSSSAGRLGEQLQRA